MLGHIAIADGADGVKGVVASVGEDGAAILLVFIVISFVDPIFTGPQIFEFEFGLGLHSVSEDAEGNFIF